MPDTIHNIMPGRKQTHSKDSGRKGRSQGEKEVKEGTKAWDVMCTICGHKEVSGAQMLTGTAETHFNLNYKQVCRGLSKVYFFPQAGLFFN